jgi:predicted amidohydrolase YtcJ
MCTNCAGNLFGSIGIKSPQMTRRTFAATAIGAMGAGLTAPARAAASDSDVIFRGGSIIPIAGGKRYAEALAVSAGRIVAVGSDAEVAQRKSVSTRVIDLDGRTLLPGFIDPHQHTVTGALVAAVFTEIGYTAYKTRAAVMSALRERAAKSPPGKWLLFANFDNLLQGGELSKAELDAVSTDHPILVYYINMHTATANSAALQAAGVTENTGALPGGGRFGRNPDGTLNGMVYEEAALKKFMIGFPKITPELAGRATIDWLKKNAAVGNTTVHEAGVLVFGNILEGYERVATQSPCRASISLMFESMDKAEPYKAYGYGARATQVPNSLLSLYAMKIVGDGSNQTKTAAQTVPYLHSSEKGRPNFDAAELKRMVAEVKAAGWPISIHCNGDATLDIALDAIESAYGANPASGVNRIEHCTIARPDQIARMVKLGVQPSFLINHVFYYGAAYRDDLFGPERAERMDAAADFIKAGSPFTLHTDAPCSNIGTLQNIQTAVTRRCHVDGSIVGAAQAISLTDALEAVTIHAAGQIGMAERIGSLEVGKEADLTILESDPYKINPEAIMDIKVSETWVAGRKMYGAQA